VISRLVHRPITLIEGVGCFLLFSGAVVLQIALPNETVTLWTIGVCAGLALFGLFLVLRYYLELYELTEEGLLVRNFLGVRKSLRWSDLRSVRYSTTLARLRLKTHSGITASVPIALKGLPELSRLLQHKAPRQAIDHRTLDVLRTTAAASILSRS
jgi:hypothetical protein